MFAASKSGGVVATPSSGDPYWTSVSLLTNFENNLTFQDGSTNNFAITRTGTVNPSLNTPFSGGVGGSEKFNGSAELNAGSNAAFAFGTGAYTVECWVFLTAAVSASHQPCFVFNDTTNGFGFWNENGINQLNIGIRAVAVVLASTTTLTANIWNHIVAVRSGTGTNLTSIFVNGTRVANGTDANNWTVTGPLKVGGISLANYYLNGFMSNVRVVKGTAVYDPTLTTLTVPTAPLTAITNTSLLITGTGQGMFNNATFVDQGPNALTVTATGAPVYSGLSPFGNTYAGSVLFNGTSQYLSVPASTSLQMGSSDFTAECWVNPKSLAALNDILFIDNGSAAADAYAGVRVTVTSTGAVYFLVSPTASNWINTSTTPTGTIQTNIWQHIAAVRSGSTFTLYVNGISKLTYSSSSAVFVYNNISILGAAISFGSLSSPFNGYISNARVVKGTAVYTANFTPSTTPLTAITNTSLLVRGDTGAFYDLSTKGLAETGVGAPVVTTQVKKFGSESGSFNGTNSYLSVPNSTPLQLNNSTAFTLECWIYPTTISVARYIFTNYNQSSPYGGYGFGIGCDNFNTQLQFWDGGSWRYFGAITANVWTHIAITYQGSGTTGLVFVNGVQQGSAFTVNANISYTAGNALIGAQSASAGFFAGYLDDIRITKGVARYTANFTPPTATFPTA